MWLQREKKAQEVFRRQQEREEKARREKEEREVWEDGCVGGGCVCVVFVLGGWGGVGVGECACV